MRLERSVYIYCFRVFVFFFFSLTFFAQTESVRNNIYLEAEGIEALSLNYERIIYPKWSEVTWGINFGVSHSYLEGGYNLYGFPVSVLVFTGRKQGHFELGAGFWHRRSYRGNGSVDTQNNFIVKAGYRFQNLYKHGINFRTGIAFTYFTEWDIDYLSTDFTPMLYLAAGYSF